MSRCCPGPWVLKDMLASGFVGVASSAWFAGVVAVLLEALPGMVGLYSGPEGSEDAVDGMDWLSIRSSSAVLG